eukprot:10924113-Alexandrium_andersonii.AAC.1
MRHPARAALRPPSAQAFRQIARPILEEHFQSRPAFELHLRELMGGAPALEEGAAPPGLSMRELIELRTKTLQALGLGHSASGARPGLMREFFEAFSELAGGPD